MTIEEVFQWMATLNRWVPYKLSFNIKRQKFDKIPHNGRHGLSDADPNAWTDLITAAQTVQDQYGLSGVGFVMTGGIEFDGWTLVGFDYDDVDDKFIPPIKTYAERSPSKVGVRQFAWAPTEWAEKFQDTLNCTPKNCAHAEIYIGTAPRFLTVTFDKINEYDIIQLTDKDLHLIEMWGMHPREEKKKTPAAPSVDTAGTRLDLSRFRLTEEQQHLINGTGEIDRSKVVMGLIITLLDGGATQPDILTTLVEEPNLWAYCMAHRSDREDKALIFAREEINRAYPKSMPGKREALIGYNDNWKVVETKPEEDDLTFPMELFDNAPGLVGEIARWIISVSYTPREEFAYAAALSMVSCLAGPFCTHGSRGGKMNLYLALVGGTGTGKNEAMDGMALLLNETDARDCISDFPASEAALRRQLNVTPNVLIRVDELAHKFETMSDTSASSMGRAILEAYNAVRMPPKPYADEKKTLPAVENPYVQILGGTTDKVWNVLRESHIDDGTLNRFVFVCLKDEPEYRYNPEPDPTVPKALKDKLNNFWRAGKMSDLIGDVPGVKFGRHIDYTPDVKKAAEELNRAAWELQQGNFGNLYSRYVQSTMKIAAILTVGDGRKTVEMKDFRQAQLFMKWSVTNTGKKVDAFMSNSNFERLAKRLMAKLKKEGGSMPVRDAYKFMHIYRREMDELTASLIFSGEINIEAIGNVEWVTLL